MDSDLLQGEVMSNVLRVLRRASILSTLLLLPIASFAGFSISNGQLVDNNGTPFIMRGVNYPYTWFQSRNTQADLAAIAARPHIDSWRPRAHLRADADHALGGRLLLLRGDRGTVPVGGYLRLLS
jgi:hypothetical protein